MIRLLDKSGLGEAQELVRERHYLRKRVDDRCSPLAYELLVQDQRAGVLIFGRPEATRCYNPPFYGKVSDIGTRAEVSYWSVLNAARVYILPEYQTGGQFYSPEHLPGFTDRKGVWKSTLAVDSINEALDAVCVDYLLAKPPCFPDEPYELKYCLSYCDTRIHKGTLYKEAGFELFRTNREGIQTWRKPFRELRRTEHAFILQASELSPRSRKYRAERAQMSLIAA